jgi:hypothetical protein
MGADYVIEIHGNGAQFDPSAIERAVPAMKDEADLILGSRLQKPWLALKKGMSLIRFVANRFLSFFSCRILGLPLTEFHTGFRVYSRRMLENVPFQKNADDYLFAFQIIAQAAYHKMKVREVHVEVDYRHDRSSHSLFDVVKFTLATFLQLWFFLLAKAGWRYNLVFQSLSAPKPPEPKKTEDLPALAPDKIKKAV